MIISKVPFTFKYPARRKDPEMKKLQVCKLCDPRMKNNPQVMLEKTSFKYDSCKTLRTVEADEDHTAGNHGRALLIFPPGNTKTGLNFNEADL